MYINRILVCRDEVAGNTITYKGFHHFNLALGCQEAENWPRVAQLVGAILDLQVGRELSALTLVPKMIDPHEPGKAQLNHSTQIKEKRLFYYHLPAGFRHVSKKKAVEKAFSSVGAHAAAPTSSSKSAAATSIELTWTVGVSETTTLCTSWAWPRTSLR